MKPISGRTAILHPIMLARTADSIVQNMVGVLLTAIMRTYRPSRRLADSPAMIGTALRLMLMLNYLHGVTGTINSIGQRINMRHGRQPETILIWSLSTTIPLWDAIGRHLQVVYMTRRGSKDP